MRVFLYSFFSLNLSCFGASFVAATKPPAQPFEARDGQYVSCGPGYSFSVTSHVAVLNLGGHAVSMSVAGASPKLSLEALDRMPGKANYILGRDIRASYDLYGRVQWSGVYTGIDMLFRGNQERLEYDFKIAAGRDPGKIRLAFEGIDGIRVEENGDLVLRSGTIEIRQPKPVSYQVVAGKQRQVDVAYRINDSNQVGFETGAYDRQRALVIDPQIVFDKSFGGSGQSAAAGLARDAQGNLYVTGSTNSTDFGTVNGFQKQLGDVALLATADGGQTFTTPTLGGAVSVTAIAASPSAATTVYAATPVGIFRSGDGGTTWTAAADAGLTGQLIALTVDAGSATTLYAGTDQGVFISTDGASSWHAATGLKASFLLLLVADPAQSGTVYAGLEGTAGLLRSTDFGQTWNPLAIAPGQLMTAVDALAFGSGGTIVAASPQGLFISTDGGKTWNAGAYINVSNTQALGVSPNNPSLVYLINQSGLQRSTDGGKTFNVVLSSLNRGFGRLAVDPRNPSTIYAVDFNLLYKSTDAGQAWTQLSPPYSITAQAIFVSPADSRVLVGTTTQNNVFVTKFNADGSQVLYSTYLGGNGRDKATGIAVDASGSAYVTGITTSANFPTTSGAFQTKLTTAADAFVAKLSPDGSQLSYSTLLGSDAVEHQCCQPTGPTGIAVDSTGSAVITGYVQGNFPVTPGAFQSMPVLGCGKGFGPSAPDEGDAFITRIAANGSALVSSTLLGGSCSTNATSIALDASGNAWIAGSTASPDFPVTSDALQPKFGSGMYDGFLARVNLSGGLDYATYIGGSIYTSLNAIALDKSGNIYVTGETGGLAQPASPNAFQPQASASCPEFFIGPSEFVPQGNALVLKLDPKAHLVEGLTYLGAPGCLTGASIAVDSSGEPWISGVAQQINVSLQTASPFRIGIGAGFISKFSADLTQLLFSTYFDSVSGLVLDSSGFAYVTGTGTFNQTGPVPVYLAKIDPTPAAVELDSLSSVVPTMVLPSGLDAAFPFGSPAIAAGEILRILGKHMGPASAASGVIQSGALASSVAGVQVTFDGVAAPILFAGAQEIDVIAPFELATKSTTTVQVQYNNAQSNPVQIAVAKAEPQILGVYNSDFSPNSASNPAQPGSIITLFVAGVGPTNPPSQNGQINAAPLAAPAATFHINNLFSSAPSLPITFAGSAPDLAAGIFQINFVAPLQTLMDVQFAALFENQQVPGLTPFNIFVQ